MDNVTMGEIVHYVSPACKHHPAMIVYAWDNGCVNLQVFLDGTNVLSDDGDHFTREEAEAGRAWRTSVRHAEVGEDGISAVPYTWHRKEKA